MTLRARLLLVLVGVVAAGLVTTDVVTYTQLQSYLLARIGPELRAAAYPIAGELEVADGLRSGRFVHLGVVPTSTPTDPFPPTVFGHPSDRRSFVDGVAPAGTIGELIGPGGTVYGKTLLASYNGGKASPPSLPRPLPPLGSGGYAIFTASSRGSGAIGYEVLARPVRQDGLIEIVAIPLTDVTQTLGRLLWVEVLVSGVVLLGLGGLAWWIVRRGLKPLDHMASTAGAIAGGQLGLRVTPAEGRTEVGRLGLALNAMLAEIQEAFEARAASEGRLRRFLADASHELRTPLTSIRGYAELFQRGGRGQPGDLETAMGHVREEADRMNVLVDDLLLLARLDHERPLDLQPADVGDIANRAIAACAAAHPDHEIRLVTSSTAVVACDAGRIRQVLDNLLGNAVRHSPPGGSVEVAIHTAPEAVVLEVRDSGPGVSDEEAARIFEPFYRADFARTRTAGGAGLGLAIVTAIVRAHGGTVGVGRDPSGGACFWVRLPGASGLPGTSATGSCHWVGNLRPGGDVADR